MMQRIWDLIVGFARFWYDFIIGDDWTAAAGVLVMIGGAYGLLRVGIPAFWFGPTAILITVSLTIRRALHRAPDEY
ncbi:MAG TPA: hypothetical protein VE127_03100 [Solirubrobacteraceae bacterium]|nr:hypothetical protein [Solirubrobacteraceae bacterium]